MIPPGSRATGGRPDRSGVDALGIDIGGSSVKAALLRPDGSVETVESAPYRRPDREALRDAVRQAVGRFAPHAGAVGLCVPGRRGPAGDRIDLSVNVPGLAGWVFTDLVRDAAATARLAWVGSDAEAATLDARLDHPPAGRVLGLALGTGVGACLIEDGRAVGIGSRGIGHFGQIDVGLIPGVAPPGPLASDGGRNGLEAYLGARALEARLGPGARLAPDDPAVLALARAVRIALAVYVPDLVLVLGGVGLALAPSADAIERAVRTDLTGVAPAGWRLAFGRSRFHAAAGAARAALGGGQAGGVGG